MSPKKFTKTRHDHVIRVKLDTRLLKLVKEECMMQQIEPPEFVRRLLSHQMGTAVVGRPPQSKKRRPLSGTVEPTAESFVIYMTKELYDFATELATSAAMTKTALLALLILDYFDIVPIKLGEMQPAPVN